MFSLAPAIKILWCRQRGFPPFAKYAKDGAPTFILVSALFYFGVGGRGRPPLHQFPADLRAMRPLHAIRKSKIPLVTQNATKDGAPAQQSSALSMTVKTGQIVLQADSSFDYDPIYLHPDDDFSISGTVVDVIKKPAM
jgi:hypothetical protein